ncbi:cytochrome P450 4C1-like [Battus philenor]|uniref:cytochrome P450 4C1-like n=1 Tax=Battus philenor TaxID=42288 RepID=UPI0035CF44D2
MFWILVVAVLVCIVLYALFIDVDPLDALPGPRRWPIIGCPFSFIGTAQEDIFDLILGFQKLYGYRYMVKVFSRRILHLYNVEDIEIILSHSRNIVKNKPYDFLKPWLGTGLLISTGTKWHQRRKILTPTFHFNILKNFTKVFEQKSRDLVQRLKQLPEEDVDILPIISDFTLYTICETAMGTQLDSDKSKSAVEYKRSIKEIGILVINRLTQFWLHSDIVFYRTALGKRFLERLNVVHSFADNVILERKQKKIKQENVKSNIADGDESRKKSALLDFLIEAESDGKINLEGIREEVNTFMFEGHDTSAMAITFGLMLLADHEEVQERIYEECKSIFGDSDRTPNWSDLAEMKYLEATIKEILRLYPSVPFIGRRITEDFMLDDIRVKKGTEVLVHIYDLHRREDIYPNPEAFIPERFLNGEVRHPYAFVPFSAGPRNCIGQRFAMLEMKCALSEICRSFKLAPKTKGYRPLITVDIVLRPVDPIMVKFIPR